MRITLESVDTGTEVKYRVSVGNFIPEFQIILPTRELTLEVMQFVSDICGDYEKRIDGLNRERGHLCKMLQEKDELLEQAKK